MKFLTNIWPFRRFEIFEQAKNYKKTQMKDAWECKLENGDPTNGNLKYNLKMTMSDQLQIVRSTRSCSG